jgi:hypothetical protein
VNLGATRAFSSDLVAFEGVGTGEIYIWKSELVETGNDYSIHYIIYGSYL